MTDGLTMTINLDYFERDLKELAGPVVDRISREALRAGAQVVLEALIETVPERPNLASGTALPVGALRDDLRARVSQQPDKTLLATIGPGKKTRHVAGWVEYGHEQSGFAGRGGEKRLIGGNLEGKFVMAHPWIRPALEMSEEEATATVGLVFETEIAKEAERLGYTA
jgi:Bacteriophage HK97-gp10, putative tail-component